MKKRTRANRRQLGIALPQFLHQPLLELNLLKPYFFLGVDTGCSGSLYPFHQTFHRIAELNLKMRTDGRQRRPEIGKRLQYKLHSPLACSLKAKLL